MRQQCPARAKLAFGTLQVRALLEKPLWEGGVVARPGRWPEGPVWFKLTLSLSQAGRGSHPAEALHSFLK